MKFNFASIPKFCISLSRCTERRKLVRQEFEKADINFSFYDAVDKKELIVPELSAKFDKIGDNNASGILACMLSHVSLIREARSLKLPAICIFEDDIVLCDDFAERIKYIESLKDFKFDFFCLGGHFSRQANNGSPTQWSHIKRITDIGGTYGYIITQNVYDFVLRNITYNYGMDEFYGSHTYKRFRTYAFVPFLAGCRKVKSEITDTVWEYENIGWHYQQNALYNIHSPITTIISPAPSKPIINETRFI